MGHNILLMAGNSKREVRSIAGVGVGVRRSCCIIL